MNQKTKTLSVVLLSIAALSGCGASKMQTSEATTGIVVQTSITGAMAKCSHDVDNISDLSIRLKAYEDGNTGIRNDLIRMKFDRFPTAFANNGSAAIQLWTRTVDSTGNWGAWHKVSFYVEKYTPSGITRSPYKYTDITWAQLKQLATYFEIGSSSTSELFGSITLLAQLDDTSVSKILTAKLYDGTSTPEVTALIPTYLANPKSYAKDHPAKLQSLHPLQALAQSSYTEDQYQYESNQFCF